MNTINSNLKNSMEIFLTQSRLAAHTLPELYDIQDFLNRQINLKSQPFATQVSHTAIVYPPMPQQLAAAVIPPVETTTQTTQTIAQTTTDSKEHVEVKKTKAEKRKAAKAQKTLAESSTVSEDVQKSQQVVIPPADPVQTPSQTTEKKEKTYVDILKNAPLPIQAVAVVDTETTKTVDRFEVDEDDGNEVDSNVVKGFCGNKKCNCQQFIKSNETFDANCIDGTKLFIAGLPQKLSWRRVREDLGKELTKKPISTKVTGIKCDYDKNCYNLVEKHGDFCEECGGPPVEIQGNRGTARLAFHTHADAINACEILRKTELYGGGFFVNFSYTRNN